MHTQTEEQAGEHVVANGIAKDTDPAAFQAPANQDIEYDDSKQLPEESAAESKSSEEAEETQHNSPVESWEEFLNEDERAAFKDVNPAVLDVFKGMKSRMDKDYTEKTQALAKEREQIAEMSKFLNEEKAFGGGDLNEIKRNMALGKATREGLQKDPEGTLKMMAEKVGVSFENLSDKASAASPQKSPWEADPLDEQDPDIANLKKMGREQEERFEKERKGWEDRLSRLEEQARQAMESGGGRANTDLESIRTEKGADGQLLRPRWNEIVHLIDRHITENGIPYPRESYDYNIKALYSHYENKIPAQKTAAPEVTTKKTTVPKKSQRLGRVGAPVSGGQKTADKGGGYDVNNRSGYYQSRVAAAFDAFEG